MNLYKPKNDLSSLSIVILTPCGGYHVYAKFAKCLANLVAYSWMCGLKVYQMGMTERMVVDWARNDLARTAVGKVNEYTGEKFTHFLWLDDDHVFNPDLAVKLADHQKDMVSALYYGRTEHLPVAYVKDESGDLKYFPLIECPNSLFECDAVGFGALLMKREIFEKVPEPWFTIDWRGGEDLAFCKKAKEYGVKIHCDGNYKLGHIGVPQIITEKEYKEFVKDKYPDKIKVPL